MTNFIKFKTKSDSIYILNVSCIKEITPSDGWIYTKYDECYQLSSEDMERFIRTLKKTDCVNDISTY